MSAIKSLNTVGREIGRLKNFNAVINDSLFNKSKFIDSKNFDGGSLNTSNSIEFFIPKIKSDCLEKKVDDSIIKDIYNNVNTDFSNEISSFMKDVISLLLLFDMKNKFMKNTALNQNAIVSYLDQCSKLIQKVADSADAEMHLKMTELEEKTKNATFWAAIVNIVLTIIEVAVAVFAIMTANPILIAITIMALAQTLTKLGGSIAVLVNPANQKAVDFMQNGLFAFVGSDSKAAQIGQIVFNVITSLANIAYGFANLAITLTKAALLATITMILNAIISAVGLIISAIKSIIDTLSNNNNEQQSFGLKWEQCLSMGLGGCVALLMKLGEDKNKPLSEQENYLIGEMIVCAGLALVGNVGTTSVYQSAISKVKKNVEDLEKEAALTEKLGILVQEAFLKLNMQSAARQLTTGSMNANCSYKNFINASINADIALDKGDVGILQKLAKNYQDSLESSADQLSGVIKALAESIPNLIKAMSQILNSGVKSHILT